MNADNGRVVLVLVGAGAAATAFLVPPGAIASLVERVRRKESSMDDETLGTLNRRYRLLIGAAIALAMVVVAAATATGGRSSGPEDLVTANSPGSPSGDGGRGGSTGKLTASDQGVTADTIRIATIAINPTFYTRFGITDPEFEKAFEAFTDEVNAKGGVNGRRWEPVFVPIDDPTVETQVAQACRTAFADQKVFMMVNTLAFSGLAECAAQNGRILTDSGYGSLTAPPKSLLDDLAGRYWVAGMTSDRFVAIWADFLATEYGTTTKLGLIVNDDAQLVAVSEQLQKAVAARGFPRPSVSRTQPDPATAAIQTRNGLAKFRSDGVQLIVPLTNPIPTGLFQGAAEATGYRPEKGYTFSSFANTDNPDWARFYKPKQMNGAKGPTMFRPVDAPEQKKCRDIYAARAPGSTYQASTAQVCHLVFQNVAAMTAAGNNLTAKTWAEGYASLGDYQGNALGTQTFSASKRDGADQVRIVTYRDGRLEGDDVFGK